MTQTAERPLVITYSAEIEERIAGLEAQLADSREAYLQLSQDYHQLSQEKTFIDHLFEVGSDKLTISHKASIHATVRYLREHERDRDERGYIKMNAHDCASMAGQSYGTLLNNWATTSRELHMRDGEEIETDVGRVPIFDRLVTRVLTEDRDRYPQGYYLETSIKERDILSHPDQYKPQTPIEWGGKRKDAGRRKCKRCNVMMKVKDHIRTKQREHICPSCHDHVWDKVERISADVTLDTLPPGHHLATVDPVNEPVEQPEGGKNQLDFCPPDGLDDGEIDASKGQLEEVSPSPLLPQVAVCSPAWTHALPPQALRELPIWCCHREKVPYIAELVRYPQKAKSNDPTTWRTYEQTQAIYEQSIREGWKNPYSGIGFMCPGEYTVIDYDHCIEDGKLSDQAAARIEATNSYAEISYSQTGIHQIARGTIPRNIKQPGCEMYDHARFVTWTGQHLAGTPETIEERPAQLAALFAEIASPEPAEKPPGAEFLYVEKNREQTSRSDAHILEKLMRDPKARKLYTGDLSDCPKKDDGITPDYSRADLALCEKIAYWGAGGNVSTIDRLFRQSGLYREKWERADYREWTINRALAQWRKRKQVAA